MRLLLATRSAHKAGEIRKILAHVPGLELVNLDDVGIPETPEEEGIEAFETFEENAGAKAKYFHRLSGLPTLADDSGLEVDALDGAPGVYSKRFAPDRGLDGQARDDENNRYLVECLSGVPAEMRGGRYVCVAVIATDEAEPLVFRGEAPGRLLDEPRGQGGFGYDPLFLDLELGLTFAEISAEEKNARSHRARAFDQVARHLVSAHTTPETEPTHG